MASPDPTRATGSSPVEGPLKLRRMRPDDLPWVMRIENRAFRVPWTERTFRSLLRQPNASLLVAELGDRLAGYAALWFVADEAELGDLAVHPDFRRVGVGAALVGRVLEEARARSVRAIYLEVRTSNRAARRLYERTGFEVISVRPRYYTQPVEDAIVMRRCIESASR